MATTASNIIHDEVYGTIIKQDESTTTTKRDYSNIPSRIEALEKYGNTSEAIRGLLKEGHTPSKVADILNIRYQHVNNVKNQILKRK